MVLRLSTTARRRVIGSWLLLAALAACGEEERPPYAPIGAEDDEERMCTGAAQTIDVDDTIVYFVKPLVDFPPARSS